MSSSLKLGVGNGSLKATVAQTLAKIGILIDEKTRQDWQETGNQLVSRVYVGRPANVVEYLGEGKIDCAIIGLDELIENSQQEKNDFIVISEFSLTKTSSNQRVKIVL